MTYHPIIVSSNIFRFLKRTQQDALRHTRDDVRWTAGTRMWQGSWTIVFFSRYTSVGGWDTAYVKKANWHSCVFHCFGSGLLFSVPTGVTPGPDPGDVPANCGRPQSHPQRPCVGRPTVALPMRVMTRGSCRKKGCTRHLEELCHVINRWLPPRHRDGKKKTKKTKR